MIYDLNRENCVKEVMIYDINREIYRMNNEIYWKIREQDGFNPMKYVCKYMEQLIDLKEDLLENLILHHLDVQLQEQENCVMIKEHHGKLRNKMDLLENMELQLGAKMHV